MKPETSKESWSTNLLSKIIRYSFPNYIFKCIYRNTLDKDENMLLYKEIVEIEQIFVQSQHEVIHKMLELSLNPPSMQLLDTNKRNR